MRKLVAYSAEANLKEEGLEESAFLRSISDQLSRWLHQKGRLSDSEDKLYIDLPNKPPKEACISRGLSRSDVGEVRSLTLTEPVPGGTFATEILYGCNSQDAGFVARLSIALDAFNPRPVSARCPKVVRDILSSGYNWQYLKSSPISPNFHKVDTEEQVRTLIDTLWSPSRSLPYALVSSHIETDKIKIATKLGHDLFGVAHVAILSEEASWQLTNSKGKEWSCYGGALRIFWPSLDQSSNPYDHPLFLHSSIYRLSEDKYRCEKILVDRMRSRIFSQASFAVSEPKFFEEVEQAYDDSIVRRLKSLRDSKQLEQDALVELDAALDKIDDYKVKIKKLKDDNSDLSDKVKQLELAIKYCTGSTAEESEYLPEELETPPDTLEEAVNTAKERYKNQLIFGGDISSTIKELRSDSGPPEKVLKCLKTLAEAVDEIRLSGSLGNSLPLWLKDKSGVDVTGEAQLDSTRPKAIAARTFHDGLHGPRVFFWHFKPSTATSPDRCVRIYFDHDSESGKMIVGCVGRHP